MVYTNVQWLFLYCLNWLNRVLNFFKALNSLVISFIIEVIPLIINVLNYFSSNNCQLCIKGCWFSNTSFENYWLYFLSRVGGNRVFFRV
jgi:hypothetical protein